MPSMAKYDRLRAPSQKAVVSDVPPQPRQAAATSPSKHASDPEVGHGPSAAVPSPLLSKGEDKLDKENEKDMKARRCCGGRCHRLKRALFPCRLPIEHCCGGEVQAALQTLHLDHILQISDWLQLSLMVCLVVSLAFAVTFLVDLLSLKCMERTLQPISKCGSPWQSHVPWWTLKFQCIFRIFGCGAFLATTFSAGMYLANYSSGKRDKEKLRNRTNELHSQCIETLARGQQEAEALCDIITTQLKNTINNEVQTMRKVLEKAPSDIQESLLIAMAKHLRDLRAPARTHIENLLVLCRSISEERAQAVSVTFRQVCHNSTVDILSQNLNLSTSDSKRLNQEVDPEWKDIQYRHARNVRSCCCPCCVKGRSTRKRTSVTELREGTIGLPTSIALRKLVQTFPKTDDADTVLLPVWIILKFISLFTIVDMQKQRPDHFQSRHHLTEALEAFHGPASRGLLAGLAAMVYFFAFNLSIAIVLIRLWRHGGCTTDVEICTTEILTAFVKTSTLFICMIATLFTLWQIRVIDDVVAIKEELSTLKTFKRHIDEFNAHSLASRDEENLMLKEVQDNLNKAFNLVEAFMRDSFGETPAKGKFQKLAADLEKCHADIHGDEEEHPGNTDGVVHDSKDLGYHAVSSTELAPGCGGSMRSVYSRQSRSSSRPDREDPSHRENTQPLANMEQAPQGPHHWWPHGFPGPGPLHQPAHFQVPEWHMPRAGFHWGLPAHGNLHGYSAWAPRSAQWHGTP